MKTLNLSCGHKLRVKEWPSREGLAKVREHYKKYHPKKMEEIICKSLSTKLEKGTIQKIHTKKCELKSNSIPQFGYNINKNSDTGKWNYKVNINGKTVTQGTAKTKSQAEVIVNAVLRAYIMKKNSPDEYDKKSLGAYAKKLGLKSAAELRGVHLYHYDHFLRTGKVHPKFEKKKKKKTSSNPRSKPLYPTGSVLVHKDMTTVGIIRSRRYDKSKDSYVYQVQWYTPSEKLAKTPEPENALWHFRVLYFKNKNTQKLVTQNIYRILFCIENALGPFSANLECVHRVVPSLNIKTVRKIADILVGEDTYDS